MFERYQVMDAAQVPVNHVERSSGDTEKLSEKVMGGDRCGRVLKQSNQLRCAQPLYSCRNLALREEVGDAILNLSRTRWPVLPLGVGEVILNIILPLAVGEATPNLSRFPWPVPPFCRLYSII